MLDLKLGGSSGTPKELLFIGAHCDDIEIGCGGAVLKLIRELREKGIATDQTSRAAEEIISSAVQSAISVNDRGIISPFGM